MKTKILLIGLIVSNCFTMLNSQIAMGKWKTHFAYNSVNQITESESKIYAVSEGALFSIDKEDEGMEFYSKLSGLSDANISRIEYDNANNQLLIIYVNGNIDIMTSGGVVNIPDLYNKQMSSSKTVNQVVFDNDKAYLSCDFGILVLNMKKKEIAETYYIGALGAEVKVLNIVVHNDVIYAITADKIYKASSAEPNLVNYQFWSTMSNLPGDGELKMISSFAGKLILLRGEKLYTQDEFGNWQAFIPQTAVLNFFVSNGKMLVFNGVQTVFLVDSNLNITTATITYELNDAEYDSDRNTYWYAGNSKGVVAFVDNNTSTPILKYFMPQGPATNIPWDMTFAGEKLFVVQGGRWSAQYNRPAYVMMYEKDKWTNLDPLFIKQELARKYSVDLNVYDFMNVAVDPLDDKHFFVSSFGNGLFEFQDNAFVNWYNNINSTLETIIASNPYKYIRLDGAIYDKNNNLYMTNSYVNGGVKILKSDGTWTKLTHSELSKATIGKIMINSQYPNQKWIPSVRYSPGIIVFDDNGTIDDMDDDKVSFKSTFTYPETSSTGVTENISVSPTYVYTAVQDKNGVVWVGTDAGPFLFYNTSKVFDSDYTCSRVKIPRDDETGLADYLLEKENIKVIAIDGANRKWIGTSTSGVYLMSENGQETIHQFTTANSPLLSNDILSIAINPVSGEVFFGTGNGIVSYQSDAVDANETFSNVHAYPNPVREGFTGIITITGLVADTQVKITDINGNLVCQTVSNGGIATWDGKDFNKRKVSTGIYLAICVNDDGTQSTITKIMVIN